MAEERFITDTSVDADVWELYHEHVDAFWTDHDITFTDKDYTDWNKLTSAERKFIENILSFFATADNIVNENLMLKLYEQIESPAARAFYSFQGAMETVHALIYIKLIEGYVKDLKRLNDLKHGDVNAVREKVLWCQKWLKEDVTKEERLLIFCCIEGVFFSGSFCAIYWLAQRGILPALCNANKLIAPDEGLHVSHGIVQYKKCENKVSHPRARELFMEAFNIEKNFISGSIDCSMVGMNKELMIKYIERVANNIFTRLGYPALFQNTTQPFKFMDRLCYDSKENFLELRSFNYQRVEVDLFNLEAEI